MVVRNAGAVIVLTNSHVRFLLDDVGPRGIHLVLERQVVRQELLYLRDSLGADPLRAALREAQQHLILLLVRILQLAVDVDRRGRDPDRICRLDVWNLLAAVAATKADRDKPLDEFWLNLRQVDFAGRRGGASIAINGFVWDGDSGKQIPFIEPANPIGIPAATVYINGELQNTHQQENQVLLGFTKGGPQGIGAKRIPKVEEFLPDNLPFQYQMYASGTNVIKEEANVGVCQNDDGSSIPYNHANDRWSID